MKIIILSITILVFNFSFIFSQKSTNSISGRVLDKKGKPVEFVDVYISGTLLGTTTLKNGKYKLKNLPSGSHELVFSFIGYHVIRKMVNLYGNTKKEISVKLSPQPIEISEVKVSSKKPIHWQHHLEQFIEIFIGKDWYAEYVKIENPEVLYFTKEGDAFTANSYKPFIIDNKALGFKIKCNIIEFFYDPTVDNIKYVITTKFEELIPESENQKEFWLENRQDVYTGSITHFLKSAYNNTLYKEGFIVVNYANPTTREIFAANDYFESNEAFIFPGSGNTKQLKFKGCLGVGFRNLDKIHADVSWLRLSFDESIIDSFGIPEEVIPFETTGYWAKIGVSQMLPKYYNFQ